MLTFTDVVAIILVILFASLFVSISFKFSIAESFSTPTPMNRNGP